MKAWLESRISKLGDEIAKLEETLLVVDSVLRGGSFMTAAELGPRQQSVNVTSGQEGEDTADSPGEEIRDLRSKGGSLLARAYISGKNVTIVPESEISLNRPTPPFNSFFVNRILEGMKSHDQEEQRSGIKSGQNTFDFQIDEDANSNIVRISIENYGMRSRLEEIINTSTWTFTRMLEKT